MKWKDIYNKCNNREYSQLININEPAKLEANFKKFFLKNNIIIMIILIAFVVLAFLTYKFNIKTFLACTFVFTITILLLIYYRSYKILVKGNKMKITVQFNDIEINCDDLVTLFLSRKKLLLFIIIPINVYYINIVYSKKQKLNIITLPTTMNYNEDVYNFLKHFEFRKIEVNKNNVKSNENKNKG